MGNAIRALRQDIIATYAAYKPIFRKQPIVPSFGEPHATPRPRKNSPLARPRLLKAWFSVPLIRFVPPAKWGQGVAARLAIAAPNGTNAPVSAQATGESQSGELMHAMVKPTMPPAIVLPRTLAGINRSRTATDTASTTPMMPPMMAPMKSPGCPDLLSPR